MITLHHRPLHQGTPGTPDHKVLEWYEAEAHTDGRPIYVERDCPYEAAEAVTWQMRQRLAAKQGSNR